MTRRFPISEFLTASACAALLLLVAPGCGGPAYEYDATVSGKVVVEGELAKTGLVTFHPVDQGGKPAIGRIHPDGSYSLRTGQGNLGEEDGGTVASGEYIVTVSVTAPADEDSPIAEGGPPKPGPSLVASKYASKETSDLKRTVKRGAQVVNLELEGVGTEDANETAGDQTAPPSDEPEESAAPPAEDAPQAPPSASSADIDNPTAEDASADASVSEDSAEKQRQ